VVELMAGQHQRADPHSLVLKQVVKDDWRGWCVGSLVLALEMGLTMDWCWSRRSSPGMCSRVDVQ
jgi:hypothetical protein